MDGPGNRCQVCGLAGKLWSGDNYHLESVKDPANWVDCPHCTRTCSIYDWRWGPGWAVVYGPPGDNTPPQTTTFALQTARDFVEAGKDVVFLTYARRRFLSLMVSVWPGMSEAGAGRIEILDCGLQPSLVDLFEIAEQVPENVGVVIADYSYLRPPEYPREALKVPMLFTCRRDPVSITDRQVYAGLGVNPPFNLPRGTQHGARMLVEVVNQTAVLRKHRLIDPNQDPIPLYAWPSKTP